MKKFEVLCVNKLTGSERYFMLKPNQQPPDGWERHESERVIREQRCDRTATGFARERVTR